MRIPPDLRPSEDVVYAARRHWSVPVGRAMLPLLAGVACLAAAAGTAPLRAGWPAPWPTVALMTLAALALGALVRLVWLYLDWSGDSLLITTHRVIGLRRVALLRESRRDVALDRIDRVVADCRGPVAAWLGTGTLTIEATSAPPIVLSGLPAPERARRCLVDLLANPPPDPPIVEATTPTATPLTTIGGGHWWQLVAALRLPLLGCGLAALATAGLPRLPSLEPVLSGLLLACVGGLALVSLGGIAGAVVGWRGRRYGVTDDELLELVRVPWRAPRAVPLTTWAAVQDVAYRVPNPLAHLFDFGDVTLTTTDHAAPLTLAGVAHPRAVHRAIGDRLRRGRGA